MYKPIKSILWISLFGIFSCTQPASKIQTDVLIIGGGTAGTAAAISSARMGVKTLLVESGPWLGGMLTAAGVSAVDGNTKLPSGFWGEFRDSLILRYGNAEALKTGWVSNHLFEPKVGATIFHNMTLAEKQLVFFLKTQWITEKKQDKGWHVTFKKGDETITIATKQLVDATELGDVAAAVGIPYHVGMDSKERYGEAIAPSQANTIIQDLTYVLILKEYEKPVPIKKPLGYDAAVFYCASANPKCKDSATMNRVLWPKEQLISYGKLPHQKYMINWPINGNDFYVNSIEMSMAERKIAFDAAKLKSLQFLYYLQTELGFDHLGLSRDEFPTPDGLPLIPYHRESRRIEGEVTLTVNHIAKPYDQPQPLYRTAIAVGDYPVDHHHAAHPQAADLPELHFYPVPSYSVPMGSLLPKQQDHFIVTEKSISVSNIANGTTRLQPVVLQLGQAAGVLAALAVKENKSPKDVSVRKVQNQLLTQGTYLLPYLDVPKDHPHFKAYQRIGVTGILRGTGKNVGWENQTWFYADEPLKSDEVFLAPWLKTPHPPFPQSTTVKNVISWFMELMGKQTPPWLHRLEDTKKKLNLMALKNNTTITRGEFAVLLDALLNPFAREIQHDGNIQPQN